MKKLLILFLIGVIMLSGCIEEEPTPTTTTTTEPETTTTAPFTILTVTTTTTTTLLGPTGYSVEISERIGIDTDV